MTTRVMDEGYMGEEEEKVGKDVGKRRQRREDDEEEEEEEESMKLRKDGRGRGR